MCTTSRVQGSGFGVRGSGDFRNTVYVKSHRRGVLHCRGVLQYAPTRTEIPITFWATDDKPTRNTVDCKLHRRGVQLYAPTQIKIPTAFWTMDKNINENTVNTKSHRRGERYRSNFIQLQYASTRTKTSTGFLSTKKIMANVYWLGFV